jgi:hypothetical protein
MRLAALLLMIACEKQGPVESTPGAGPGGTTAPVIARVADAGVATIGSDAAGVVAPPPADAAVARATPDAARRPSRDPAAKAEEDARAFANILASEDSKDWDGDMSNRRPGADLDKMIVGARGGGRTVVIGGGAGRGGGPRTATGSGPGGLGSASAGPLGRVAISAKRAFDDTSLTVDLALAKIQNMYMTGIKRCYRSFLQKDATARGKVKLRITVNEAGRSVGGRASGFAAEIDACVTSLMASWRFPMPKDADGDPTEASFEIDLQLVPD